MIPGFIEVTAKGSPTKPLLVAVRHIEAFRDNMIWTGNCSDDGPYEITETVAEIADKIKAAIKTPSEIEKEQAVLQAGRLRRANSVCGG